MSRRRMESATAPLFPCTSNLHIIEYESYCLKNGLCICEESAEQFVHHKDEELEKAIENGEA